MKQQLKTRTRNEPRRRLEISIDAMTTVELERALNSILRRIRNQGDGHSRYSLNDILVEFDLHTYGEIDYRIEEINGKLCYIYKSKL